MIGIILTEFYLFDIQVFTSKQNSFAYKNQKQFGWVYSEESIVKHISCKEPLPNNLKGSIIVGAFIFSKARYMIENILLMEKNQKKINNEYYMDMSLIEALKNNYTIFENECKKFNSVGTPDEVDIYLSCKKK